MLQQLQTAQLRYSPGTRQILIFKGKFISLGCHFLISLFKNQMQRFQKLFGELSQIGNSLKILIQ